MDDFVIIHHDKQQLHQWRVMIERFINCQLRLKTNSKTQVFPVAASAGRSLDFLGYRIYANKKLLRKSSVKRIKAKLKIFRKKYSAGEIDIKDINQTIQSWIGHASHADTFSLRVSLLSQPFKRGEHV